jgi:DnaJ-class molecular chaperone
MTTTYYEILGVAKNASDMDIKKAYRALSLKYHPDRNPDPIASEKIKEINNAYNSLSDKERRSTYDMEQKFGGRGQFDGFSGMPFPMNMPHPGGSADGMNDIFQMLFAGGLQGMNGDMPPNIRMFQGLGGHPPPSAQLFRNATRGGPPQLPDPITNHVSITLEQAYAGCTLPIEIERYVMVGDVKIQEEETVYVTIPPGSDENEIIALREKGNVSIHQAKGDIKVVLHVVNNTPFRRKGLDLHFRKSITLKEALCGFSFDIPHINGKTLSLNNRTNVSVIKPTYTKVVHNLGMIREKNTGRLIIEFDIQFPDSLNEQQRKLLGEIL